MDGICASLHTKMSKIESSFLDLNKEITTSASFLHHLKQHSEKIVKELQNVSCPTTYLKEFIQVNSFLLKYLDFLTEFNCKFEMMQILDKGFRIHEAEKIPEAGNNLNNLVINLHEPLTGVGGKEIFSEYQEEGKRNNSLPTGLGSSGLQKSREKYVKEPVTLPNHVQEEILQSIKPNSESKLPDNYDSQSLSKYLFEQFLQTLSSDKDQNFTNSEENFGSHKTSSSKNQTSTLPQNCATENHVTQTDASNCKPLFSIDKSNPANDALRSSNISLDTCTSDFVPPTQSTPTKDSNVFISDKTVKNHINASSEGDLVENKNNAQCSLSEKSEIKPLNISAKPGDDFDVVIEHIKSPSEFYVHIIDKELNCLADLEKILQLIPVDTKRMKNCKYEINKTLLSKEIGTYALYYSKCDEVWYRAKVTDWCMSSNNDFVKIFLLDYGESKCVSVDSLQPMPEFLKAYPAFAQRCHLYGIYPIDMHENNEALTWGREASEKMRHLIEKSNKVKIKIVSNDRDHSPLSWPVLVSLVDQDNKNVNKLLVESKYAIQKINNENQTQTVECPVNGADSEVEVLRNWNPMKEDFESYQNTYDFNINDPAAAIYGYVGKDYDRVCRQFAKTGSCYKGEACRKEHVTLDPSGFTTDQEEVYKNAFNALPCPSPNEILHVEITCVSDVNQFFCIQSNLNCTVDEENLSTLLKFMNNSENIRKMRKLLIPPSIGQIVIAQFSEDDSWYRAKILESQPENDSFTLIFVDYGNSETVSLSRIRAMEPRYLHLPFQAMQCFIFGIERNPEASLKNSLTYLNKRTEEAQLRIEVVSKLPGDVNLMVNLFDENGKNIAEELTELGFAIYKDEIPLSNEGKVLPG